MNIVIPMAGEGKRFAAAGYDAPKPFLPFMGRAMIESVIDNIQVPGAKVYLLCRTEHVPYFLRTKLSDRSNVAIIPIDRPTEGAACTVLKAKGFIDSDEPLIIANSDQYVDYDRNAWLAFMACAEAGIMTFPATETKWSYSLEENGRVIRVAEKQVISEQATVGIYYFAKGSNFVWGARRMMEKGIRVNGEFYVCPVFNELIGEITVKNFPVFQMYGLGTPEDYVASAAALMSCA